MRHEFLANGWHIYTRTTTSRTSIEEIASSSPKRCWIVVFNEVNLLRASASVRLRNTRIDPDKDLTVAATLLGRDPLRVEVLVVSTEVRALVGGLGWVEWATYPKVEAVTSREVITCCTTADDIGHDNALVSVYTCVSWFRMWDGVGC